MTPDLPTPREPQERAEPQTFRARELAVSLTVDDLDESLHWYRDMVGFVVEDVHKEDGELRAVMLKAGRVSVILNQDDGARGWDRAKGEGFSLHFSTAQSVDALADRIRARGGTLDTEPADMPWGVRSFRVTDPTGFVLNISSLPR